MTTDNTPDVITILKSKQQPLADKLKQLDTTYRAERAVITAELKPLNKAINILTPKTPPAPKPAKAPKKGGASVAK